MAQLIKANGVVQKVQPKEGNQFSLQELQDFVNGYIEIIYLPEGKCLVVNEEGKVRGLPINKWASNLIRNTPGFQRLDTVVGDVLYCNQKDID